MKHVPSWISPSFFPNDIVNVVLPFTFLISFSNIYLHPFELCYKLCWKWYIIPTWFLQMSEISIMKFSCNLNIWRKSFMKFSWIVDVKQNWILLFAKKSKNAKSLKIRFVYFAWNFHEIKCSYPKSDLISHPFHLMKVPLKLKHVIWDICMSENTYL